MCSKNKCHSCYGLIVGIMNAFYSKMNRLQVNEFIRMLYIDISGISTTIFITLIVLKS